MIQVLFGDNYGETYTSTFETEEQAKEFANMEIRKLTILKIEKLENEKYHSNINISKVYRNR